MCSLAESVHGWMGLFGHDIKAQSPQLYSSAGWGSWCKRACVCLYTAHVYLSILSQYHLSACLYTLKNISNSCDVGFLPMIPKESRSVMKSAMQSWVSSKANSSNHRWITCERNKKKEVFHFSSAKQRSR